MSLSIQCQCMFQTKNGIQLSNKNTFIFCEKRRHLIKYCQCLHKGGEWTGGWGNSSNPLPLAKLCSLANLLLATQPAEIKPNLFQNQKKIHFGKSLYPPLSLTGQKRRQHVGCQINRLCGDFMGYQQHAPRFTY